jgi:nucleotide-binding universal stress UspA family protein
MRILLCSEGTERSENAIQFCLQIASATHSEVTIFGVTELEADEVPLLEAIRQTQHAYMAQGVNVEILSTYGEPISEIEKRAREGNYDLIVIGGEAKPSGQVSILSQKAYEIIETLLRPVLVVPVSRPEIRRILICTGGGTYIEAAVRLVIEFAPNLAASVTLFTAIPEAPVMISARSEPDVDVAALLATDSALGQNLRAEKEMIEAAGIPTEVRVRAGLVADEIAAEIEAGDYDLVVLGSKPSRDVFSAYLLGNMTRRLVNWVPRPVLVVASEIGAQRPRSWLERITGMVGERGERGEGEVRGER